MEAVKGYTYTSQTVMPSGTIAETSAEVGRSRSGSEEVASGWRQAMDRQKQAEDLLNARVQKKTTGAHLMSVSKEEVPSKPEWQSSLDQNNPPELPSIEEELWTNQKGEQLQWLKEADVKFTPTPVTVKGEDRDVEKPQSSQLNHTEDKKTEADVEGSEGPEPENNVNTGSYLKPLSDDEMSPSSEPETDDSCDWEETSGAQSGLNPLRNNEEPEVDQFPVCEPATGGAAELPEEEEQHKYERRARLMSVSEEDPAQKEWRSSLDRNDPPELPSIKEEQVELWTSQDGEQLRGLEDADLKFTPTPVTVKSEEREVVKPQSSQLNHTEDMKTEADGEDCGGAVPEKSVNTKSNLKPLTDDEMSLSSEPETDDSCDWEETSGAQSGLNPLRNDEEPEGNTGITPGSSSECTPSFDHKKNLQEDGGIKIGGKQFICSVCGKKYTLKTSLTAHMRLHSEEKRFSCSVCKKNFIFRANLLIHMRVHTGEKPFGCTVCSSRFTQKQCLRDHMRIHSGEKPFSCSVCGRRFIQCANLLTHLRIHTGEKPFSCTVCGKTFAHQGSLRTHMRTHTGEKPFSCSVCEKSFTQLINLKKHKCAGESSGSKGSCSNAS